MGNCLSRSSKGYNNSVKSDSGSSNGLFNEESSRKQTLKSDIAIGRINDSDNKTLETVLVVNPASLYNSNDYSTFNARILLPPPSTQNATMPQIPSTCTKQLERQNALGPEEIAELESIGRIHKKEMLQQKLPPTIPQVLTLEERYNKLLVPRKDSITFELSRTPSSSVINNECSKNREIPNIPSITLHHEKSNLARKLVSTGISFATKLRKNLPKNTEKKNLII